MDLFVQKRKPARPPPDDNMASVASRQVQPSVKKSNYASSLWEAAVAKSTKKLPQEITGADPSSVLLNVCDEATARQKESEQKQWKVKKPGKDGEEVKLREVYGVIASCAMRFRVSHIAHLLSPTTLASDCGGVSQEHVAPFELFAVWRQ